MNERHMTFDPCVEGDFDILSALRGPDDVSMGAELAKTVSTAVIRYFVGLEETNTRLTVHNPTMAKLIWRAAPPEKQVEARRLLIYGHYAHHVQVALKRLGSNPMMKPYVDWFANVVLSGGEYDPLRG